MLVNHLDRIPVLMPRPDAPYPEVGGTVRPIFIGLTNQDQGWSYFTDTSQMASATTAPPMIPITPQKRRVKWEPGLR